MRGIARIGRSISLRGAERILQHINAPGGRMPFTDVVHLKSGALMHCDSRSLIEWRGLFLGDFEPEVRVVLEKHLGPGDWAIDVGANVGMHTLSMALQVGSGRVIAFEPHPGVAQRLRANIRLNGMENVDVVESAVLDGEPSATLQIPPIEATNQGMSSTLALGTWESIEIPATTIDDYVETAQPTKVALIKIDVEGREPAALRGAEKTLRSHAPILVFEYQDDYWKRTGDTIAGVTAFLHSVGYRALFLLGRGGPTVLRDPPHGAVNILATPDLAAERILLG